MTVTKKESSDKLRNRGKGQWDSSTPYWDTMGRDETMALRGYQLVDGRWVA